MPPANFDMRVSCCIRLGGLGAIHGLRQRGRPWVAAAQEVLALALALALALDLAPTFKGGTAPVVGGGPNAPPLAPH